MEQKGRQPVFYIDLFCLTAFILKDPDHTGLVLLHISFIIKRHTESLSYEGHNRVEHSTEVQRFSDPGFCSLQFHTEQIGLGSRPDFLHFHGSLWMSGFLVVLSPRISPKEICGR